MYRAKGVTHSSILPIEGSDTNGKGNAGLAGKLGQAAHFFGLVTVRRREIIRESVLADFWLASPSVNKGNS